MTSIERTPSGAASKSHNRRVAVVSGALVLGLLGSGGLVLRGTEAAFNASVSNGTNTWAAGSVDLQTDLASTLMFDSGVDGKMVPGRTLTKCIEVRYTGDTALNVKLYAGAAGVGETGLSDALKLTVEEGDAASTTAGGTCGTFTAVGAPIYNDVVLSTFKTTNATYGAGAGTWTTPASNQNKVYRFKITLPVGTADSFSGKIAKAAFTWEGK